MPGGEVDVADRRGRAGCRGRSRRRSGCRPPPRRARAAAAAMPGRFCQGASGSFIGVDPERQPPAQIDDHRRGRAPDPPVLPIRSHNSCARGRARRRCGPCWCAGIEQVMRAAPRTSRRPRRDAGVSVRSGRDDADHRRHLEAGDGPVAVGDADHLDRGAAAGRSPPRPRAGRRRSGRRRRDRSGRRES